MSGPWRVALAFQKVAFSLTNLSLNVHRMPFYAVAKGRTPGIYMTWADCEAQVKGFSGARYKKFDDVVGAQDFIVSQGGSGTASKPVATAKKTTVRQTFKPPNQTNSGPSSTKRSFSTSSFVQNKDSNSSYQSSNPPPTDSDTSETFTDEDDDLNTILSKQLDDVEKRLKGFEKGVDKIIKNSQKKGRKAILIEPPKPKRKRVSNSLDFEVDSYGFVQVYTDGACSSNGKAEARAGIGVYWSDGHPLNTSEPVSGRATNNCGEIQAATKAIKLALENGITKLSINTDSKFLINSVTKWIPGWKKKGWKLGNGEPVKNEIDFKDLDSVQNKLEIQWNYVEAHKGIHGNEMADQLARAGAARYNGK